MIRAELNNIAIHGLYYNNNLFCLLFPMQNDSSCQSISVSSSSSSPSQEYLYFLNSLVGYRWMTNEFRLESLNGTWIAKRKDSSQLGSCLRMFLITNQWQLRKELSSLLVQRDNKKKRTLTTSSGVPTPEKKNWSCWGYQPIWIRILMAS